MAETDAQGILLMYAVIGLRDYFVPVPTSTSRATC